MMPIEIAELGNDDDHTEWRNYVSGRSDATLYHSECWRKIIHESFGHRIRYLLARSDGRTCGVLPLVEMRSWMFGHFLTSLPFVNYGGILADSPAHEAALATAAAELATRAGARHIEIRQTNRLALFERLGWALREHKAALVVKLDDGVEKIWGGISSRLRGKVRKAGKSGAVFSVNGPEALRDFYRVFALNMRNLGTPTHSMSLFSSVLRWCEDARLLLVHREGLPVAGALALRHSNRVELPWICSDYAQSNFNVNEFLYWRAIEWAVETGATDLDLGRSSIDAGTYRFKTQWNPAIRPLAWYYWLSDGAQLPELNPHNPQYTFAVRLWKKLPMAVANAAGPAIVRNIP